MDFFLKIPVGKDPGNLQVHLCSALSLCRCWAVRVVVSWALACRLTQLVVVSPTLLLCRCLVAHPAVLLLALLSCHLPYCHVTYLAVVSPTLLSCRLPWCRIAHPVVISPALLPFGTPGCHFTCPVLVRPFTLVVGFQLGIVVLSLHRGLHCIIMAILVAPLSPSWLYCCCRHYCIVIIVIVASLSLSWLHRCHRPGYMVIAAWKRWHWEEGGKWVWWKK